MLQLLHWRFNTNVGLSDFEGIFWKEKYEATINYAS